jgi:hypothetical protein
MNLNIDYELILDVGKLTLAEYNKAKEDKKYISLYLKDGTDYDYLNWYIFNLHLKTFEKYPDIKCKQYSLVHKTINPNEDFYRFGLYFPTIENYPIFFNYRNIPGLLILSNFRTSFYSGSLGYDIEITLWGDDCTDIVLDKFQNEAREAYIKKNTKKVGLEIYSHTQDSKWYKSNVLQPKDWNSIFLAKKIKDEIYKDVINFRDNIQKICIEKQIKYKRTYLFGGSPGMGKTSLVIALGTLLNRNIYKLCPASAGMSDDLFQQLLTILPPNVILLIEDVDYMFNNHKIGNQGISFQSFTNTLDGVASVNGLMVILTSNHPEFIDPIITRSGRVNCSWTIEGKNYESVFNMINHWLPNSDQEEAKTLTFLCLEKLRCKNLSLASLESFLFNNIVENTNDIKDIIKNINKLDTERSGTTEISYST